MAAEELKINYSTAKTIVQTFKCQKRFAKIPKRSLTSLRTRKREGRLRRVLTKRSLPSICERIFLDELKPEKCAEIVAALKPRPQHKTKAVQNDNPLPILPIPARSPSPPASSFPVCEPGPKVGQVSRGTDGPSDNWCAGKLKDVFYIYTIEGPESLFRHKIDYTLPMKIRHRHKRVPTESPPLRQLPPLDVASTELSEIKEAVSYALPNDWCFGCPFDLSWYKAAIAAGIHNRYLSS